MIHQEFLSVFNVPIKSWFTKFIKPISEKSYLTPNKNLNPEIKQTEDKDADAF